MLGLCAIVVKLRLASRWSGPTVHQVRTTGAGARAKLANLAYDLWLDPGMRDVGAASELLKPYDARSMRCYPVSTRFNHVANDDEECSKPVELAQIQNRLFS
jgi:hypothetical protein